MILHKLNELERILSDAGIETRREISFVSTPDDPYITAVYTLEDETQIVADSLTHNPNYEGERELAEYRFLTVTSRKVDVRGLMEDVARTIAELANVELDRESSYFEKRVDNPTELLATVADIRTQYERLQKAERKYQVFILNLIADDS